MDCTHNTKPWQKKQQCLVEERSHQSYPFLFHVRLPAISVPQTFFWGVRTRRVWRESFFPRLCLFSPQSRSSCLSLDKWLETAQIMAANRKLNYLLWERQSPNDVWSTPLVGSPEDGAVRNYERTPCALLFSAFKLCSYLTFASRTD